MVCRVNFIVIAILIYRRKKNLKGNKQTALPDAGDTDKLCGLEFNRNMQYVGEGACLLDMCPIKEGEQVFIFQNCKHIFHLSCINEWNKTHAGQCPSCLQ